MALPTTGGAVTQPKPTKISYYYDAVEQSLFRPTERFFDPALLARRVSGNRREAANVDDADQVRLPSTWWQPRLGFRKITIEQMLTGPGTGTGPAAGTWSVVRAKTEGVSKGFQIKDAEGHRFAIKFDPTRFPELATGADVVTTYLFWAAGYNVPDNTIAFFRREDLAIAKDATYKDALGRDRPMTATFLDELLAAVPRMPDGRFRAVASRFLPGKSLGEWEYNGRRKDDPEDAIPHQLRREIRGLYTFAAWVNHVDCSARNTLDMWVTDGDVVPALKDGVLVEPARRRRSFVRHHLLDFSGCLGSASIDKQLPRTGSEYFVDFGAAGSSLLTLGLVPKRWESGVDPEIPNVGYFESVVYEPDEWKPFLPNPAFDERTERDMRWGARIVAGFTDEHIRAAVSMGKYSDPRAVDYLTRVLIERRDKIVRRWLESEQSSAIR